MLGLGKGRFAHVSSKSCNRSITKLPEHNNYISCDFIIMVLPLILVSYRFSLDDPHLIYMSRFYNDMLDIFETLICIFVLLRTDPVLMECKLLRLTLAFMKSSRVF